MKNILWLLTIALCTCSCKKKDSSSTESNAAKDISDNILVDGKTRTFQIYIPSQINTDGSLPLVFILHGGGGTGAGINDVISIKSLAEKEKFILVFPDGIEKNWNDGRPTNPNKLGIDDVSFFDALITKISGAYKIDAKKIYAAGISNGGFMSMRLGCQLSNRFAAVAAVAASVEQSIGNNCTPSNKVSALIIQGIADPIVPFNGGVMTAGDGGTILSHTDAISKWITVNSCSSTAAISDVPDISNDGTTTKKRLYSGGANGTEVISYIVTGGGHTWPGGKQYLSEAIIGKTSTDFNANEVIWNFFKTHPKP